MCLYPIKVQFKMTLEKLEKKYKINKNDSDYLYKLAQARNAEKLNRIPVPCGRCVECEIAKTRQWAIRCMYELKNYDESSFLTLTYDNDHLPKDNSVSVREVQLFIKRLRKSLPKDQKIKYIACGEYGELGSRPHYHLIIFGKSFDVDKSEMVFNEEKQKYFNTYWSSELKALWPFGFHTIEEVNFNNCKYVAKYCQKQLFAQEDYDIDKGKFLSLDYGEVTKPFFVSSKGLGYSTWVNRPSLDTGKLYYDGSYINIPRSFLDRFERENHLELVSLREQRLRNSVNNEKDSTELEKKRDFWKNRLKRY